MNALPSEVGREGRRRVATGWDPMRFLVFFGWWVVCVAVADGQVPPPSPTTSSLQSPVLSSQGADGQIPPLPSATKSPVAVFRELLAMSLGERRAFLTNRPPEAQQRILAKVREYETMRPDDRELRLRVTELRWHLLPLMSQAPTNRAAQIAALPEDYRQLVEDRLRLWDILPPALRKELLENEATLQFFTELNNTTSEAQQRKMLENMPADRRQRLEAAITKWNSMPETERRKIVLRFNQFFDLNDRERQKTLNTLSEPERRQMEKTLAHFEQLNARQRAECIRSFEKFAGLSLEERQQFLKNAERWKLMSPEERDSWRHLVSKLALQPLMPVRIPPPPIPMPPIPRPMPAASNRTAAQ